MARRKRTHAFPTIIHDALIIHDIVVPSISFFFWIFYFIHILHVVDPCPQCVSIAALRFFFLTYIPIFLSALGFFHDKTVYTAFLG